MAAAAKPSRESKTFHRSSSKLIQPKQSMQEEPSLGTLTTAQKSTLNLRSGTNRRSQSVAGKKRGSSSRKKDKDEFTDLGLSGAKYQPIFD